MKSLFPPARRAASLPREIQDIQTHANGVVQGLRQVPFLDGVQVAGVALTGGSPVVVAHPLGRAAKGTPLVLQSVSGGTPVAIAIADDPTKRSPTSSTITSTSTTVATLWFY